MSAPLRTSHRSAYLLITPCTAAYPLHPAALYRITRLNLSSSQLVYRAARLILSFIASPSPSNGIGAIAILAKRGSLSAARI